MSVIYASTYKVRDSGHMKHKANGTTDHVIRGTGTNVRGVDAGRRRVYPG